MSPSLSPSLSGSLSLLCFARGLGREQPFRPARVRCPIHHLEWMGLVLPLVFRGAWSGRVTLRRKGSDSVTLVPHKFTSLMGLPRVLVQQQQKHEKKWRVLGNSVGCRSLSLPWPVPHLSTLPQTERKPEPCATLPVTFRSTLKPHSGCPVLSALLGTH